VRGGNYRQAAQLFARVRALAPENLAARLWLAQLCVVGRFADQALKVLDEIHAQPEVFGLGRTNQTELLSVEASAHLLKGDLPGAEAVVDTALKKYPEDEGLLSAATQIYLNFGCHSNALGTIEQELKIRPDNQNALISKGYVCLQLGAFTEAIAPLTQVLAQETNNFSQVHYSALLDRAIAYLRSDKLDESQRDYEVLQKAFPTAYPIYFGLGEIAYRKQDTNAAVRSYRLFLANAPTNSPEVSFVNARVKELRGGKR